VDQGQGRNQRRPKKSKGIPSNAGKGRERDSFGSGLNLYDIDEWNARKGYGSREERAQERVADDDVVVVDARPKAVNDKLSPGSRSNFCSLSREEKLREMERIPSGVLNPKMERPNTQTAGRTAK
jgi:hypothetical protein